MPSSSCCCHVVGWRTDNFNFASQRAIERPGRQERRRDPRPCAAPRRHHSRHGDVQHAQVNGPRYARSCSIFEAACAHHVSDRGQFNADRLLLHPARGQAARLRQRSSWPARGAAGRRGRPHSDDAWSLDDFYYLARTALVKDESISTSSTAPLRPTSGAWRCWPISPGNPRRLAAQMLERELTPEQKAAIEKMGWDELMERSRNAWRNKRPARGRQQVDRTGGTSPFGHGGYNPQGIRIGGAGKNQSAVKVWGAARLPRLRRPAGAGHAQHQGGAAPPAQVRARGP